MNIKGDEPKKLERKSDEKLRHCYQAKKNYIERKGNKKELTEKNNKYTVACYRHCTTCCCTVVASTTYQTVS